MVSFCQKNGGTKQKPPHTVPFSKKNSRNEKNHLDGIILGFGPHSGPGPKDYGKRKSTRRTHTGRTAPICIGHAAHTQGQHHGCRCADRRRRHLQTAGRGSRELYPAHHLRGLPNHLQGPDPDQAEPQGGCRNLYPAGKCQADERGRGDRPCRPGGDEGGHLCIQQLGLPPARRFQSGGTGAQAPRRRGGRRRHHQNQRQDRFENHGGRQGVLQQ